MIHSRRTSHSRFNLDQGEEADTEGSWAVSYGDMVTLLLTFFIVFFAIDPGSANHKAEQLKVALLDTLNLALLENVHTGATNKMTVGKDTKKGIDPEVIKAWGGLAHDEGDYVIIEFPGVSFFGSGQTHVNAEGEAAIEKFVQVYMPYAGSYNLSIRAFADHRQVKAKRHQRFKDNLELTALRSVSTMRSLQKAGVPLSRIKVGGYGEMQTTAKDLEALPKEKRGPASHLDLARKVVLVIEPEDKK